MDKRIHELVFQLIDQTISTEDFERLQNALEQDADLRAEYLQIVHLCQSLDDLALERSGLTGHQQSLSADSRSWGDANQRQAMPRNRSADRRADMSSGGAPGGRRRIFPFSSAMALATAVLVVVAGAAFWLGRQNAKRPTDASSLVQSPPDQPEDAGPTGRAGDSNEAMIAGHATLRRAVDVRWEDPTRPFREGDILPRGLLRLKSGVAEIDLFCGAGLLVEGPAELDIESDWSVRLLKGRLRASVPPAARGFVVKAADTEIVDLGTEFALAVDGHDAHVAVLDGEIQLRGGQLDGRHLTTGERQRLSGDHRPVDAFKQLSTRDELQARREAAERARFAEWTKKVAQWQQDERLIAYFLLNIPSETRVVPNTARTGRATDGLIVGPVERALGRFGRLSSGLNFARPGARVRTRIDGTFQAFTFVCWARIDSLEHRYNALFMADGYENGEPHWQIRDDGRLMLSVMVDDTQDVRFFSQREGKVVRDAGLHRIYYTPPFWDISKSGQWFHLAAVYDPIGRRVQQYVNGEQVSSEEIIDKFHVAELHIGPSEIGNWGQPFRKTPWFAVRNLDGTIDELAIFNAALTADEIRQLYEQGKPLGY